MKPNRIAVTTLLFCGITLFASMSYAATYRVCASGGTFPTIQAAINAAASGDTILVCPGGYPENISFLGKSITVQSEEGPSATIIDGGQAGSVVSFVSGETVQAVLNGFTITNGSAASGGGIYATGSPTVKNCIITGNNATRANGVGGSGGGLYLAGSAAIVDCVISNNDAAVNGGGIEVRPSGTTITRCSVSGNHAGYGGGGIHLYSPAVVDSCSITGNSANSGGGGIAVEGNAAGGTVRKSVISGNVAAMGGGIALWGLTVPLALTNNVITNNQGTDGGGIYFSVIGNGTPNTTTITNSTITSNTATDPYSGGGFSNWSGTSVFVNCILWGNAPVAGTVFPANGSTTINNSDIAGGWADGTNNIDANPLFAGVGSDPFKLTSLSPCIDRGTNSVNLQEDILGIWRPLDGNGDRIAVTDMGAYEYVPTTSTITATKCSYDYLVDQLSIQATSPNNAAAKLFVVGHGAMTYQSKTKSWTFSSTLVPPPGYLTICGPLDGCVTK